MELAQIGATPKGGVCRLTLTDLDKQGRDLVSRWAREAGLTVTIDKIGNGFLRRAGRNNSLPPVVTGSHIDTQPTGGKFDGNYGVLAGLEVVRTLNDHGIETEAPIEVAWWTNEEGSRFVPVMMGSGVFAKAFTLEHAYAAKDTEGKTVKDELQRIGYIGAEEPGEHPIGCYFETHIEQGPVLEDHDKTIGVVHRRARHPLVRLRRHRHGSPCRPDADGAAQGRAAGGHQADAGGGGLRAPPPRRTAAARWAWCRCSRTAATSFPGRVKFSIDLRNASDALCDAMDADIRGVAAKLSAETGLPINIEQVSAYPAQPFHAGHDRRGAARRRHAGLQQHAVASAAPGTTRSTWRGWRRRA